jgi:hypothetical protein
VTDSSDPHVLNEQLSTSNVVEEEEDERRDGDESSDELRERNVDERSLMEDEDSLDPVVPSIINME